jgi:opacity protein-like surface antigen
MQYLFVEVIFQNYAMKKVLAVFTFFSFFLFGHTVSAQNIRNGLVIGFSASQIDGDGLGGFDKPGLIFGGSSNFKINDKFSFQPEILFLQKGSKSTDRDSLAQANIGFLRWRLNYVSVPVLLRYKIQPRFTVQGGLTADYLISAKQDVGYGYTDRSDEIQKFDLGYTAGLEFQIWDNLAASARYQYSFKWLDDLHFKNSNVLVTLRLLFGDGE